MSSYCNKDRWLKLSTLDCNRKNDPRGYFSMTWRPLHKASNRVKVITRFWMRQTRAQTHMHPWRRAQQSRRGPRGEERKVSFNWLTLDFWQVKKLQFEANYVTSGDIETIHKAKDDLNNANMHKTPRYIVGNVWRHFRVSFSMFFGDFRTWRTRFGPDGQELGPEQRSQQPHKSSGIGWAAYGHKQHPQVCGQGEQVREQKVEVGARPQIESRAGKERHSIKPKRR